MKDSAAIPTVHVGKAWRLMLADLGVSQIGVLRRAGLPLGLLDGDGTRISLDAFYALWAALSDEADDPRLALEMGQIGAMELFDPALFAAMCSPDMNTAARRLGEFKRLVGAFSLDVDIRNDVTHIRFRCKYRPDTPLILGLTEIVFLVSFVRRATRHNVIPARVCFPTVPPSSGTEYKDWFGCPMKVGEETSVTLWNDDAARPFLTHDSQMWSFFEPALQRRMDEARNELTLRERVEAALAELLPSGRAQVEHVARELAVSKRSLQRQLAEEGTTWLEVLNATRERFAKHYLKTTRLGVSEISFLLGFDDPNLLFRAFQRWTNSTPEAWRTRHQIHPE